MGSNSAIRILGAAFHRLSVNRVPSLRPATISPHGAAVHRLLSSSVAISSNSWLALSQGLESRDGSVRKIWTSTPLCMGRKSSKIARKKGIEDLKKSKLYSKIGKEVISVVKKGGPNPTSNPALAAVLEKAKELDVPKEIVERNIKKASEKGQEDYIEKTYEVYGYGGVSMVVEVSTDSINRSVAQVRKVVRDIGGKMAGPGSVLFKFRRVRAVNIKVSNADKDQLLDIALDAGAEDVIEPPVFEDDADEDNADRYFKIVCSSENYSAVISKLREESIAFETDNGSELLPIATVEADDEAMELNKELMDSLLELDDVDAVYTDQK